MTGESPLQDRRRGLEEEFFARENRELLDRMRSQQGEQEQREALRQASGIADEAMIDRFLELGLSPETVAALTLVPLVEVAWADDTLDRAERETILSSARSRPELAVGSPVADLLEHWLAHRPDAGLFQAWDGYASALGQAMEPEARQQLREDVVGLVREVAESAGGTLGLGRVSRAEKEVIARIERTLQ